MTARHLLPTPGPAAEISAVFGALVPQLETARTRLRAPRLADFVAYREIVCGDRGAFVGGPMSEEDAWLDFASLSSCWMLFGHGGWSVLDKREGRLLGFVVLGLEPGDQDVELGFLFLAEAEGRGYAFEAAQAIRDWAFTHLRLKTLDSYIDARNERSIALAGRLGATDETPRDWAHPGLLRFRHYTKELAQ
ncbi:MAG: GNAT family N-acetyltransferase [Boseongicola sp.]|nr:GNAT family N-acetyltransferase [Boseongicola sp.]